MDYNNFRKIKLQIIIFFFSFYQNRIKIWLFELSCIIKIVIIIYTCVYKVVLCAGADIYNNVNSRRNYVSKHDVSKSVCPKITNGSHLAGKHYRVRRRI